MTSRRLAVPSLVALALRAAWWWFATGLSAEERWLVGTWRTPFGGDNLVTAEYAADRRYSLTMSPLSESSAAVWSLRNGRAVVEHEASWLRRLLRPVSRYVGVTVGPQASFTIRVLGEDQFEVIEVDGTRRVWTRVAAD